MINQQEIELCKIKIGNIIAIDDHIYIITNILRAKNSRPPAKYHIMGNDIFNKNKYESIISTAKCIYKIIPEQCNADIVSINSDNTCNLICCGNIIKNIDIPKKYINDIIESHNEGLNVNVSVDNYVNAFCIITDFLI